MGRKPRYLPLPQENCIKSNWSDKINLILLLTLFSFKLLVHYTSIRHNKSKLLLFWNLKHCRVHAQQITIPRLLYPGHFASTIDQLQSISTQTGVNYACSVPFCLPWHIVRIDSAFSFGVVWITNHNIQKFCFGNHRCKIRVQTNLSCK